jgi:hypothetical protein
VLYQLEKLAIGSNEVSKVLTSTMMKVEKKAALHSGIASKSDSAVCGHKPASFASTSGVNGKVPVRVGVHDRRVTRYQRNVPKLIQP